MLPSLVALFGCASSPPQSSPVVDVTPIERASSPPPTPLSGHTQELSEDAPKRVRFGAILIVYEGAEGAERRAARSRGKAEALARELHNVAREDFATAVERGDEGSFRDVGIMYRGILEPAAEYALFSLDVQGVSPPIDTPRGFVIFKRLE